jgi:hypothetical protein
VWGSGVITLPIFTSVLGRSKLSALCPGRCTSGERTLGIHSYRGLHGPQCRFCMGPSAGLNAVEKRRKKCLTLARNWNTSRLVCSCLFTDWLVEDYFMLYKVKILDLWLRYEYRVSEANVQTQSPPALVLRPLRSIGLFRKITDVTALPFLKCLCLF